MLSIGYIGSGPTTQALIQGWQGNSEIQHLVYSKIASQALSEMKQLEYRSSVLEVWEDADIVILTDDKTVIQDLAPQLAMAATVKPSVIVTSTVENLTLSELHELLGSQLLMARAVPNFNVNVREGYTGMTFDVNLDEEVKGAIAMLFLELGRVDEYTEAQLPAVGALTSAGPALVAKLIDDIAHAAVDSGLDPERAILIAEQSLYGTAANLKAAQISPKMYEHELVKGNASIEKGLAVLTQADSSTLVQQALKAVKENIELNQ